MRGSTFLDGCAGVGAIGIEAISRGAQSVVFVDQSKKAGSLIRENLEAFEIKTGARILVLDLAKALDVCSREERSFDIAYVDPPYDRDDIYKDAFQRFAELPLLVPEGLLIFEHSRRKDMPEISGRLRRVRSLTQGDSALAFYRPEVV